MRLLRPALSMLAVSLLAAASASAELAPGTPESVVAAAVDCWQAVNATAVDEAGLRTKGWAKATIATADRKAVPAAFSIYGKAGSNALLMIAPQVDPRGCTVMSRLGKATDLTATAQLLLRRLEEIDSMVEGKRVSPTEIAYFLLPKAAVMRPTGSPDKPGTLIQISYTASEKK